MKDDKYLEKFAVEEEKLEKVDGGADKIMGGKKKKSIIIAENLGGHKVDDDLGVLVRPADSDI